MDINTRLYRSASSGRLMDEKLEGAWQDMSESNERYESDGEKEKKSCCGDRGSNEKVERKRWRCGGKLDSWPPGGIRLGARVCVFPCVCSPPHSLLPMNSDFPKPHLSLSPSFTLELSPLLPPLSSSPSQGNKRTAVVMSR